MLRILRILGKQSIKTDSYPERPTFNLAISLSSFYFFCPAYSVRLEIHQIS